MLNQQISVVYDTKRKKMVIQPTALNEKNQFVGVDDLEKLIGSTMRSYLHKVNAELTMEQQEDFHAFLLTKSVQEMERYVSGVGSVKAFLVGRLKFRCVDWFRMTFHDDRAGDRPTMVAFDDLNEEVAEPEVLDEEDWQQIDLSLLDPRLCRLIVRPLSQGVSREQVCKSAGITMEQLEAFLDSVKALLLP